MIVKSKMLISAWAAAVFAIVVWGVLASTRQNALVLDPFAGSSSTGIAANLCGRRFVGVEREAGFCEMSRRRREEFTVRRDEWAARIPDLQL